MSWFYSLVLFAMVIKILLSFAEYSAGKASVLELILTSTVNLSLMAALFVLYTMLEQDKRPTLIQVDLLKILWGTTSIASLGYDAIRLHKSYRFTLRNKPVIWNKGFSYVGLLLTRLGISAPDSGGNCSNSEVCSDQKPLL